MRIFKNKWFVRFARKERITDAKLVEAVKNAEKGFIDADYGGGVFKQRIAPGEGKSGGYRSIILFRRGKAAFFVYGFAKSEQDNIDESDERDFKELAKALFAASDEKLKELTDSGKFTEVKDDEEDGEKGDKEGEEL